MKTIGRKRDVKRNSYFCIGLSQLWRDKIHNVIKRPQKPYGLKWIRVRFSYHRFPNLEEILQGDIVGKIRKGIGSKYIPNRDCNCSSMTNGVFVWLFMIFYQ